MFSLGSILSLILNPFVLPVVIGLGAFGAGYVKGHNTGSYGSQLSCVQSINRINSEAESRVQSALRQAELIAPTPADLGELAGLCAKDRTGCRASPR